MLTHAACYKQHLKVKLRSNRSAEAAYEYDGKILKGMCYIPFIRYHCKYTVQQASGLIKLTGTMPTP